MAELRRSHREPQRRSTAVHLGQWTQLLRDAEYGRLNKVLEALVRMPHADRASVSGNVLVRCIERCTPAKLPVLHDIISLHGVHVNAQATLGSTTTFALVRAAYHGQFEVVGWLLQNGADMRKIAGTSASTLESVFSAAVRNNHMDVLERLLDIADDEEHWGEVLPEGDNEWGPVVRGLLRQALWQAFEQSNLDACRLLVEHRDRAAVDDVFASMLWALDQAPKFARFLADAQDELQPLAMRTARPWYLPPAYAHGAATLILCLRRRVPSFPNELFDNILRFLPCDPALFVDDATLRSHLPRREFTTLGTSSCKFAILSQRRYREGEVWFWSDEEEDEEDAEN